jgi:hypothetical protein
MASGIGDLVATFGVDSKPAQAGFNSGIGMAQRFANQVTGVMGQARSGISSLFGKLGLGGGLGGLLGGAAVGAALWKMMDAAGEAGKAQKKLGVILESTGAAGDISKGELMDYAAQLQKTTNYSKDATIAAMGTLAVFKQRMSGDTFKDAIKAAMDINSVMGGDLTQTTRAVGMALADPVKGLRLLRSQGVLFTEEQKAQIQNAMKHNDLIGAQGVILKQITATFGGDAEKMASPMTQLKNQLTEISVAIGSRLRPMVVAFVTAVSAGLDWIVGQVSEFWGVAEFVFRNFSSLGQIAVIDVALALINAFPEMEGAIQKVGSVFVGVWAGIKAYVGSVIANIKGSIEELGNVFKALGAGIAAAWDSVKHGNFSGVGAAFGDAFMKEFTTQVDVNAPNAVEEFRKAYQDSSAEFDKAVAGSGGMKSFLGAQREELQKGIAKNELDFSRKQQEEFDKAHKHSGVWKPPDVGGSSAVKAGKDAELPKIMERSSDEAWNRIVDNIYGLDKEKNAERTADASERSAEALEEMRDRDPDFAAIGS